MIGVNPFAAADEARPFHRRRNGASLDVYPHLRDLPPALRPFFERALAHRPQHRFHTAFEIHAALEAAASSA
jgi:hypothetical protein